MLSFPESETTVAQLIERAKKSSAPVEIRVQDTDLVVAVLSRQDPRCANSTPS